MDYKKIDWYQKDEDEILELIFDHFPDIHDSFYYFKHLTEKYPKLDISWLEIFEDLKNELLPVENIDAFEYFIKWYNQNFPDDFQNRYEFVERDIIDYYLFKRNETALQPHVDFVKQYPISGMDTLTVRLLHQLIYHGKYDKALDFAKTVWEPVSKSEDLIGTPEYIFVLPLFSQSLQDYYEAVLAGSKFNTDTLFSKASEWGFSAEKELQEVIIKAIEEDFNDDFIKKLFHDKNDYPLLYLNMHFLKFMYQRYKAPFIFSEFIWHFITTDKIFGKYGVDNYFFIDAKTMDKFITERLDSYFGSNELEIFGKVWGFDFIIEFFGHFNIITAEQKQIMTENNLHFKDELVRFSGKNLWQLDFVFDWPLQTQGRDIDKEKQFFHNTFDPESDEFLHTWDKSNILYPENERISKELSLAKRNDLFNKPWFSSATSEPVRNEFRNIGRNDPCPCGSGKKYKKCCLNNASG